jgi:tRNA wybutosine-synthesizing protein 5
LGEESLCLFLSFNSSFGCLLCLLRTREASEGDGATATTMMHACALTRTGEGKRIKTIVDGLGVGVQGRKAATVDTEGGDNDDAEDVRWLVLDAASASKTRTGTEMCEEIFDGAGVGDVLAVPVAFGAVAAVEEAVRRADEEAGRTGAHATRAAFALRLPSDGGGEDGGSGGTGRQGGKTSSSCVKRGKGGVRAEVEVGRDARGLFPPDASPSGKAREFAFTSRSIDAWRDELVTENGTPVKLVGYLSGGNGAAQSELWDLSRVRELCDERVEADVHVCPNDVVDLAGHRTPNTRRNFEFRKMPFGELLTRVSRDVEAKMKLEPVIERGERYYLRSVDGRLAANLQRTHPRLADALNLPVVWPASRFHSSVLRISSSDTTLWTHYDTHDNLLVQVVGRKRVTLFPPEADQYMYVQGSSSRVENISPDASAEDIAKFPLFYERASRTRMEITLDAGDALYIPAFWFHHVYAESAGTEASVAVNVFWRDLANDEYDAKDIYGNKDIVSGKEACELALRAGDAIKELPEPYKSFYARRAIRALANQIGARVTVDD